MLIEIISNGQRMPSNNEVETVCGESVDPFCRDEPVVPFCGDETVVPFCRDETVGMEVEDGRIILSQGSPQIFVSKTPSQRYGSIQS